MCIFQIYYEKTWNPPKVGLEKCLTYSVNLYEANKDTMCVADQSVCPQCIVPGGMSGAMWQQYTINPGQHTVYREVGWFGCSCKFNKH